MTKVLLTGASGFVGTQVLRHLVSAGAHVTAILRKPADLPKSVTQMIVPDLFNETQDNWAKICTGFDRVIHVAWYAEPGKYLHSLRNIDCLTGTLRLAQGAAEAGVAHFTGVGTCFEYDLTTEAVKNGTPLETYAPIAPATPYGAAKAATYMTLARSFPNMPVAWCRLFYLYGENEDTRRLVPYIKNQLAAGEPVELTSGRQVRDFMDVADAGAQIAEVGLKALVGPFNICSGKAVTVASFAQSIAEDFGRPDLIKLDARPDRPDDPPFVVGVPSFGIARKDNHDTAHAI